MTAERDARRYLFLAQRKGDTEGAARYAAVLASLGAGGASATETEVPSNSSAPVARTTSGPVSGVRRSGGATGSLTRFFDEHPKAILGTTVVVSAVAGIKLNEKIGQTVTPLDLQPSSAAGLGLLGVALVARQMDLPRSSKLALAAALGQGIATVNAHVPGGGLMSPKKSPVV